MQDVNNTRYHLLLGYEDWNRSQVENPRQGRLWEYDPSRQGIRLQAEVFTLPQSAVEDFLDPQQRRDSARDQYGHWYWLGKTKTGTKIWARWAQATKAEQLFPASVVVDCSPTGSGDFMAAIAATPPVTESLAGLAVIPEGYLVVGSQTKGDLLVFDLYALDAGYLRIPLSQTREAETAVRFDLEVLNDGGLLVLDRPDKKVWRFDRYLRPVTSSRQERGALKVFQPKRGLPRYQSEAVTPEPITLHSDTSNPVAIAPLPNGYFWILDNPSTETEASEPTETEASRPKEAEASRLWLYDSTDNVIPLHTEDPFLKLATANLVDSGADDLNISFLRGYDFTYLPQSSEQGILWIADVNSRQAYAIDVQGAIGAIPFILRIQRKYYPLRKFENISLITTIEEGEVYYHQTGDRWVPIKALPRKRYETEATLILPHLDGREPNCLWHRLCLDACIPPETEIRIEVRAAEQPEDLIWATWQLQPPLYQRHSSEIPYSSLWSDDELTDSHTGTWELLLQKVQGRHLQTRLTLIGNGRSTPFIRALRAHYPRFSYLREYLPAVYQQDDASASFLDRFLANPEGIFTTIEGLIAQVQTLFDVRTAPPDTLNWLASWMGLALEPAWSDYQRRLLIANAPYFFQRRGTYLGLLQAILLTLYPEELGPCLFQDDLTAIAKRFPQINQVRIVERFLTRSQPGVTFGGGGKQIMIFALSLFMKRGLYRFASLLLQEHPFGDPIDLTETPSAGLKADAVERAHQFIVVVPIGLSETSQSLLQRLLDLEKPAHTAYTIKQYWALFRIGEIRLGIDTVLGQGGQFETFQLGETALAEASLGEAFPYNLTNRTVLAQ